MSDNVKKVEFKTGELSIEPNKVLDEAKDNYTSLVVIGWDKEGFLDVRSTNNLDQKDCVYLSNLFTHKILSGDYAPED
jgi:hypothetical protein